VDLFSGAGGLSLGLEQAGFDVVASVEYDPVHAAVHEFNFPLTEVLCRDVARLDAAELRAAVSRGQKRHDRRAWDGDVDLVVGGPPCQGFSLIGKRLVDDPRNQLVFHFFRLVTELRPRYFVLENVPGMRVGGHSSILERLIAEFEGEGYDVLRPVKMLNAAEFGVPQIRPRIFVIGSRSDSEPPAFPAASSRAGATVWDAIGDIPDLDEFEELWETDEVRLSPGQLQKSENHASPYARLMRGLESNPEDLSYPRVWDRTLLTSSRRTRHTPLSISRFTATRPGEVEPISRFLRLPPDGFSNALRAGTGSERGAYTSPRPIHPFLPRVISVREAARLHSFPDWFRFHRTKWHGFRSVGNAVAPLVGRAVGQEVAKALRVAPKIPTKLIESGSPRLLEMSMTEAADYFGADAAAIPPARTRAVSNTG
jgi:DNA (cytosine-5)-methyltransferase 1